jgi:hypothetical protein
MYIEERKRESQPLTSRAAFFITRREPCVSRHFFRMALWGTCKKVLKRFFEAERSDSSHPLGRNLMAKLIQADY